MRAHKVISAFKAGGTLIEPPGEWTPNNQAKADRLIAAGCLKAPKEGVATATELEADGLSKPDAAAESVKQGAIADGKSEGAAGRAADKARAEMPDEPTGDTEPTQPGLIDRAKAAITGSGDKPKGGKRSRK